MPNNGHIQFTRESLSRRNSTDKQVTPMRGVRQDNPAPNTAPSPTPQPAPRKKDERPAPKIENISRTQQKTKRQQKDVKLDLWVKPRVKAELQRIAKRDGLSISAAGEALLEKIMQQDIYTQHAALLDPIINRSIGKHMRAYSTRLAVLLVRCVYATEHTRSIATNILERQEGMTQETLARIIFGSSDAAKRNITNVTPQLKTVIEEVAKWFEELEKGGNGNV